MTSGAKTRAGAPPAEQQGASLVTSLISDLLGPGDDLDRRVDAALARIGGFAGADRAYVVRIRDNGTFDNTHEWVADGIAPAKPEVQGLPVAQILPVCDAEAPVAIASVADLPPEAPHRARLLALGVQSLLCAPMVERGRLVGYVGVDSVCGERSFAPDLADLLGAFARLLTGVTLRAEAEATAAAALKDLAEQGRRLRTTLSAVPDAVLDLDAGGRIVVAQSRMPDLFTHPAASLIGAGLEAGLHPDLAAAGRRAIATLATGCERLTQLFECQSSGRCIKITAVAHEGDAPGAGNGCVLLLRDVTAERRQEEERELLEEVARRTDNLVVVTDARRRITWVNEAFERLSGWTLDEVRGRNPAFLQTADTDPGEIARIRAALDLAEPVKGEVLNRSRDGRDYWVELDIQPTFGPGGTLRGFHSVQTDITERKATAACMEAAMQRTMQAHERLGAAIDSLPDAFAYFDASDRLVLCNDPYRAITRVPGHDDIVGLTFQDLMQAVADRRIAAGQPIDAEAWIAARLASHRDPGPPYLLQLLDGRWMKVHEQRTPDGGCVMMLVDVSAEREAAQRLEDTLDAARAGTWEWQLDDDRLIVDDRIARMLGYGTAADLGLLTIPVWQARMHPDDLAAIGGAWDALRRDAGEVSDHVYRVRNAGGQYIWVLSRGRQATGAGGSRIGVLIDISARKRLEAELEAERDYLETLMQTSIAAITGLDADGKIVYCNREAERLFGLPAEEIESRTYDASGWRICAPDGSPLPSQDMPFARVLASGQPVTDQRLALERADGGRQILSVNAAPVERPGSPIRVVCAIRDVTAEMEAERALQAALARAQEATETKSRFLASMSHEIRTPLNGVLGMAELLDLSLKDPRQREMLGVIRESGALLLSVLNDILDMSKIEAGKLELDIVPLVPDTLVGAVEALHTVAARRKGIDLVVWTGVGLDRARMGDPHRIQQILHNLVGNAVKFTDSGEVAVTLAVREPAILSIRVRDTGPGMTPEQMERIFGEFEQADGTVARRFGGSGLGLAIVHRLVGLMGGDIALDSAPGKGTEVRVTIPLPEAPVAEPAPPAAAAGGTAGPVPSGNLAGLRALVAEDNGTNRLILRAMLDRLGIAATIVADGTDAVAAWAPGKFDLLLLDITMPLMGGVETLQALRAAMERDGTGRLPAVAITANAMTHQIAEYLAAGFDAHLSKPLSLAALESAISRIMNRQDPPATP